MSTALLLPPLAFLLMLALVVLHALGLRTLAPRRAAGARPHGMTQPYACGEDVPDQRMQPDYAQFFPFAFFFTLMHVAALVVATVPRGSGPAAGLAAAFLASAAVAVYVLFRR